MASNPGVFQEIGRIGQRRTNGVFYEEFVRELTGTRGVAVYKEMADNDEIVGAILFALEMLIRQAAFDIVPSGTTEGDWRAAEFVKSCMDDMQYTWTDTISEILSFLTYGWSYHEIVYKRRAGHSRDPRTNSKFNDRLIGWRKLPIRSQDTLLRWDYDQDGDNFNGMVQAAPPTYAPVTIPRDRALHFMTKSRKINPEGRSILRNSYRSWYFRKRIQEIEGIGIERDLAGFPIMKAPEGIDLWDPDDPDMVKLLQRAETIVTSIRRDNREGLVMPNGWDLQLLSTGSRRNFDTGQIIERYDNRIAMTVMADFILLGHQQVGSFALSSDKTHLFSIAIGAYLDIITETFNGQGIPRLIDLNGDTFRGITGYPTMTHGDVETPDLAALGAFIRDMTGVGVIVPGEELEAYVRQVANLPERLEGATGNAPPYAGRLTPERQAELDALDAQAVAEARKKLYRDEE